VSFVSELYSQRVSARASQNSGPLGGIESCLAASARAGNLLRESTWSQLFRLFSRCRYRLFEESSLRVGFDLHFGGVAFFLI
jgi:hypothetical protein